MAGEIVTSCPLCLALSDPVDMLDIEIDRIVPRGRAHVLLCRICGSATVRAMALAGEPLAQELLQLDQKATERAPARDETPNAEKPDEQDPALPVTGEPRSIPPDQEGNDDESAA